MSESRRLQVVQRVTDAEERRQAERLGACERRVSECEAKLGELEGYQASYAADFARAATNGMAGARLRDFQAFMARLGEAVRQQGDVLARAREERDAARANWQRAAQRAEIVDHVVTHRQNDEQRALDQKEQRESDERAQNHPREKLDARGV
jgi:flagellar FliJ protein